MKNFSDASTISRKILIFSLFLITILVTGFIFSCQSQESMSPATSPGLPEETTSDIQPRASNSIEVAIEGFAYKPAEISILVGSTITWQNKDSVIHTVTDRGNSFNSGNLSGGKTYSYTFEERGIFEYYCIPHPYMQGKVIVD